MYYVDTCCHGSRWRLAAINQAVLRTCCTIIMSLPCTLISWRCISMGETFFAHKNWITLRGTQLDEYAIGSSIVTVLLHSLLPTTRYEKKSVLSLQSNKYSLAISSWLNEFNASYKNGNLTFVMTHVHI